MDPKILLGYRFDAFEVNLGADTLLRDGQRIRIQQLPFQVLVFLLENAGTTVSRDELRQRLWSDSSFIEWDNNLRVAVTKLREALGEPAAAPRYIRTVARKGYQFVGEPLPLLAVSAAREDASAASEAVSAQLSSVSAAAPLPPQPVDSELSPVRGLPSSWRLGLLIGVAFAVLCFAALLGTRYAHRSLASAEDRVALGTLTNQSGDPAFDAVLTPAFRLKLQESPYVNAFSEQEFRHSTGARDDIASQSAQLGACTSLGGSLLLDGRLLAGKPGYRVELKAIRCRDRRAMATIREDAGSQSDVLPALGVAIEKMRRRLGESDDSLRKYNVPLTEAVSGSLFALKAYAQGMEKQANGQEAQSISDYKLAIDLDPQFAMAYAHLGTAYLNAHEYAAARANLETAFKLRDRTTDRQRLSIAAHYYSTVTGELPRAIEAYQLWHSVYPRDVAPVINLAGIFLTQGAVDQALSMAQMAVELAPGTPAPYALLARADLEAGRFAELNGMCHDEQREKSEMVLFHSACYLLAFTHKDEAMQRQELQWANGNPQECVMLEYQAWTEIYQGRLTQGRTTFARARQSAFRQNNPDFAAELDLDEAGLDADLGDRKRARERAHDAISLAPESRSVQAFSALALAHAGELDLARAQAAKAAAQAPLDAIQRDTLLAATRGSIQTQAGDIEGAIRSLEAMRPYDDVSDMALSTFFYRGMALAEAGRYDQAAHEFQHALDHRSLCPESIYSLLAELHLARLLQLTGHPGEAELHYAALRSAWKNADAGFPLKLDLQSWQLGPTANASH